MANHTIDKIEYNNEVYVLQDNVSGYEANQNAFSNVKVGSTTIAADTKTDTLELAGGTNISLTPDATNDKVTIAFSGTIPDVPSNIVNTITTTAGAHTAITNQKGDVSFNVPTTAAHVGAAASSHAHGNITNGGDITATAPTIASGDQIIINDNSASKITNGPTFDGSTTTTALTPKGTWESFAKTSAIPTKTTTTPKMDGTAAVGSETKYAAGDHVHPTDTSRVPTTRKVNGKALSSDVTLTGEDINLGSGSGENVSIYQTFVNLEESLGDTFDTIAIDLDDKVDKVDGKGLSTNDYTTTEKNKLSGIASGAEVNQNAFSNVKVKPTASASTTTTIAADSKTDTLELAAGTNISLTPDTTNGKVTIAATDTTYSDFTGATSSDSGAHGLVPAPASGKEDYVLTGDGTWENINTTATRTTTSYTFNIRLGDKTVTSQTINAPSDSGAGMMAGIMTGADKTKLNGIATGAEVNQNAFSNVKVGSTTIAADSKTDTLELVAGTGVTLTPDATNDKVTIAAEANQNAFSNVKVGSTTIAADSKTDTLEFVAGTHISLVPNSTDDKVTFNVGWPYEGSLSVLETGTDTGQRTWPANAIADYVNEVGEAVAGLIPNTFSNVKVGSTTIAADSKTDTLELVAGTGVTLTPDATNDKVTISATSSGGGMVNLQDGTGTGSIEMSNASAVKSYQTALGKYNKEDTGTDKDLSNFAFIIGDGSSSSARSNLFTINNSGLVTTHPFSSDYNWKTSSAAPNETQYFTGFEIRDRDEVRLSHIDTHIDTTGKVGTVLGAERMVGNDIIRNQIYLYVGASGSKSYLIDDPAAFRSALGIEDYITDQGTTGIWTYRKWGSGIAECWGVTTAQNYAITNTYGQGKYVNTSVNYPSGLFIDSPIVHIGKYGGGDGLIWASVNNNTTSTVTFYVADTSSHTVNCRFCIRAVGRWRN